MVRLRQVQPMRNVVLARRTWPAIRADPGQRRNGERRVAERGGPVDIPGAVTRTPATAAKVTVGGGDSWRLVSSLRNDQGDGRRYAYKLWLNAIAFGGGNETGAAPPEGAEIRVTYRNIPDPRGFETDTFKGTGKPWQVCPALAPTAGAGPAGPHELEPRLEVRREAASSGCRGSMSRASSTWRPARHSIRSSRGSTRYGAGAVTALMAPEKETVRPRAPRRGRSPVQRWHDPGDEGICRATVSSGAGRWAKIAGETRGD